MNSKLKMVINEGMKRAGKISKKSMGEDDATTSGHSDLTSCVASVPTSTATGTVFDETTFELSYS